MSYRSFKKLLGETDLERKCRFLLGSGTLILMSLSFWAYARQTEGLAYDQMVTSGRLLVPPILAREHLTTDRREAIDTFQKQSEQKWPDELSEYQYKILQPNARQPENKPEGEEVTVVNRLAANAELTEESSNQASKGVFHYYGSIRASGSCVECHNQRPEKAPIKEGDMVAVVKVTLSTSTIESGQHMNRALLLSFAIITSLLIVTGSYLIIRYVVVKPVKHLKQVSDAIVAGQFNVRSEIHTRDEFEDLSEAFNRMVRTLMDAQGEQKKLNLDLDRRLDELARANMALYESNKAKSDFLSTVSHELRTPLNGIIGFSDVLLGGSVALNEKQARWVVNIKTSGQQLLTLINDILDLAKIEAGKVDLATSPFSVPQLFDELRRLYTPSAATKGLDFHVEASANLPGLCGDSLRIRQVLTNLLGNALKFTAVGVVRVGAGTTMGVVPVNLAEMFRANRADQPEPVVQIVVVDHGHPTPPQWWRCSKWRAHKEGTPPDAG